MDTTWRKLISAEMTKHREIWDDVVSVALEEGDSLDAEFDNGFGGAEGCAFTVWTRARVYFPVVYDGAESVASVARKPNGVPSEHVGGE